MKIATLLMVPALLASCAAENWRWPEGEASVRIDTKVHFIDEAPSDTTNIKQFPDKEQESDEPQFEEPTDTAGFYNQPPGAGRYAVHVEHHRVPYRVDHAGVYNLRKSESQLDGSSDTTQYCKCVATRECNLNVDSVKACGVGKFLCCYKRPNTSSPPKSEIFNEIEDERPLLLPGGGGERAGAFPPAPGTLLRGGFSPAREVAVLGAMVGPAKSNAILFGPGGPTGLVGPTADRTNSLHQTSVFSPEQLNQGVLVGPTADRTKFLHQTGVYRPEQQNQGVLVGPGGPTGTIGPDNSNNNGNANRGVLSGPGGPTGITGPAPNKQDFYLPSFDAEKNESAQRGVLVGPGGPTGVIGPGGYGRRPILVGPGGPTGIIGPYFGGRARPVLVGPGGPTGMIGPPRRYFGK